MTLLERTLAYLERHQVESALIGGMALAAHGLARATNDTDLLLTDRQVLSSDFWKDWIEGGAVEIRTGDADDPLAGVVNLREGAESVDLVVGRDGWMTDVIRRRTILRLAGGEVPVVDRTDLVLLKLYAGGPQDLLDIRLLLNASPKLSAQVEERLSSLPRSIRSAWEQL